MDFFVDVLSFNLQILATLCRYSALLRPSKLMVSLFKAVLNLVPTASLVILRLPYFVFYHVNSVGEYKQGLQKNIVYSIISW